VVNVSNVALDVDMSDSESRYDRGCVITLNSGHGVTGISSVPIWKATV